MSPVTTRLRTLSPRCSNLESSVQWAISNDNLARQLGQQARHFAKTRLQTADMECYTYRLLLEYAAIVY